MAKKRTNTTKSVSPTVSSSEPPVTTAKKRAKKVGQATPAPRPLARALLSVVRLERFKAAFKPGATRLRPFTVIVGRNGSGKSTLLEALQWLDVTLRYDAVKACERYVGVKDLINLRTVTERGDFKIGCEWKVETDVWKYDICVAEDDDHTTPTLTSETLSVGIGRGQREVINAPDSTDRLALARLTGSDVAPIRDFWRRAVFLRLNPSSLAEGSLPRRTSNAPLLDEHGETLPALLHELNAEQRKALVNRVQEVLPGMRDVQVSNPGSGRSERVHYELTEEMKYKGRAGRKRFPIPAWMLSEGTRRLTALFALLVREPPASLLCVEEVENGLDPWAARILLRHLRDASERGTQVILTTHSPWVLDEVDPEDIILVRRKKGDSVYERFLEIDQIKAFAETIPAGTRYTHLEEDEES